MEEKEHLEELKADLSNEANQSKRVGMNGELLAATIILSVSLIFMLFCWLVLRRIYTLNWLTLGIGVLILILGLTKYYRVKNENIDF